MKRKRLLILLLMFVMALNFLNAQEKKSETGTHWWNSRPNFMMPFKYKDAKKMPLIEVKGNRFINSIGDTILFRGVSISDPDKIEGQGHWNKEFFIKVKELGAELVRIPIHPVAWRERTPNKFLELIDQAVEWCTDLNMYIIIDWHSIGNLKMGLFQNEMYNTSETETLLFWKTIARRYSGINTVAFYEIYNEPTTYFGQLGNMTWEEWKKFNEDAIALIRSYDNETIPLVAAFDWAYDLTPILINPVAAERIAYVTHPYPNKRSQPWEPKWEENFGFAAGKYPVIATEWGYGHGNESGDDYGNRIINYLESKHISWCAWVFDAEWVPNMLKSWDNFTLNDYGEFIKKVLTRPAEKINPPVNK